MKRFIPLFFIFILAIGCASLPEPNNDQTTLLIGKSIFNGKDFESLYSRLNGTHTYKIELTILNKETNNSSTIKADTDGIFSLTTLPNGEYSLKKLTIQVGDYQSGSASYMILFGPMSNFTVEKGKVNNLGVIKWNGSPNEIPRYFVNDEYNEVHNIFLKEHSNSAWLKREWITVNVHTETSESTSVSSVKKEYDKSLDDANKFIENNPKSASAYVNRGLCYTNKKEYEKALADFDKAIEIDPKCTMAYIDKGYMYEEKKEYDKGIIYCNKAIEFDPKNVYAYNNRGRCYEGKKEYEKAMADYNKAIDADPKFPNSYNSRGVLELKRKQYEKALIDFNMSFKLDQNKNYVYICLAMYNWHVKKSKTEALNYLEIALQKKFIDIEKLYDEKEDEGYFLKGLNKMPEFKEIVQKYNK